MPPVATEPTGSSSQRVAANQPGSGPELSNVLAGSRPPVSPVRAAEDVGLVAPAVLSSGDPVLSVPVDTLEAALSCPADFSHAHDPVLLVHGVSQTPEEAWSSNYAKVLPSQGFDVCTVALPDFARADVQVQTEYVVHAVTAMAQRAGGKVDVVAHSLGSLGARAAMKWWPGSRALVDDLVLVGAPNHGIISVDVLCATPCIAPYWQMKAGSTFLAALNARDETPGHVSYTSVFSRTDLAVQPALAGSATSDLSGASSVAVQDLCLVRFVDHGQSLYDAAVYAVVMDALTHAGPADPARIDRSVCLQLTMPGVDPPQALAGDVAWWRDIAIRGQEHQTEKEPPLAAWAVP